MARWHALPPAVQAERREQWQAWHALPSEQQARLRSAAIAYAASSESERRWLQERYAALDRSEQRGWMLGPALGADYMHLQPLLAQVPAAQREPLLAMLRVMTPAERSDLAVLAQRVAPQQRDALRRDLLATNAGNRAAGLQLRLEQLSSVGGGFAQDPSLRAEAVAETCDAFGTQPRCVLAQVAVERGHVDQRVLHAQCDPRRRRRRFQHFEDARAGEAGQREDAGDMRVQPAPVLRGNAGLDLEVDLVHDHHQPLSSTGLAHTRLPSTVSATPIDSRIT
jgi:hypothetical protein